MGSRREGREWALRALFLLDCNPEIPVEEALRRLHGLHAVDPDETPAPGDAAAREFGERIVRGTWNRIEEIDAIIRKHSVAWRLERMALVDRNLLRLGTYELLFGGEVPRAVAIDEAVELAKRYGGEGSAAFVNGLLDKIASGGER